MLCCGKREGWEGVFICVKGTNKNKGEILFQWEGETEKDGGLWACLALEENLD